MGELGDVDALAEVGVGPRAGGVVGHELGPGVLGLADEEDVGSGAVRLGSRLRMARR